MKVEFAVRCLVLSEHLAALHREADKLFRMVDEEGCLREADRLIGCIDDAQSLASQAARRAGILIAEEERQKSELISKLEASLAERQGKEGL